MTDLIKFLRTSTSSAYNRVAADHIEQTEAKLTKAVEFLKTMADYNKYVIAPFLAELEKKE
jgi:hypothetical protein